MAVTEITLIEKSIVRNLLKTPYYLRIPTEINRKDRVGRQIVIPSSTDVEIDYRDWKLVEHELIVKDHLRILKIIRYPKAVISPSFFQVIINYNDLPPAPQPIGTVVWVQYGPYQGLYYYDTTRDVWLSENETLVTWNSTTNVATQKVNLIHHAEDTRQDNDTNIAIPCTITGIAASQVNQITAGNSTRFAINTYEIETGVIVDAVTSIDLSTVGDCGVHSTTVNAPVSQGQILSATRIKTSGSDTITRPAVTVWYRKRLIPF